MQHMQMWSYNGNELSLLLTHTRCLWESSRPSFGIYVNSVSFGDGANSFLATIFTLFTDSGNIQNDGEKNRQFLKYLVNEHLEQNHCYMHNRKGIHGIYTLWLFRTPVMVLLHNLVVSAWYTPVKFK